MHTSVIPASVSYNGHRQEKEVWGVQSKGFVSGGRAAMRNAGVPAEHLPYEDVHYDRWFDFITKREYERYGIEHAAFREIATITMRELEEQTGCELGQMDVVYNYQRGTGGYAVVDPSGPFFVHIDQSLDMELFGLTLAMVTWMRDHHSNPSDLTFFRLVLYCMNELFILGNLPGSEMRERLFDRVASDMQILDLASDLYWAMLVFTLGHEFGHAYQMTSAPEFWTPRRHGSEYHADSLGYRVLLRLIRKGRVGSFQFEPFTCLAPMMYFGYYQMARETDRVLYGVCGEPATHPVLSRRKNALHKLYARSGVASEDAEGIYQWFLFLYDEYARTLRDLARRGRLEGIRRPEERLGQ